ncbi:MAG: DUF58 domain-containing protein [Gammaproteobacteria bacterium]|nr:DUF58 domain-containing protein [Gammaproteobacteria bacterium]
MQGVTITLDELLALRYLANKVSLPQQRVSTNSQQGNFQSAFRGRGMDFVETRIYQPGDDIRTINWAVTARTGKPHTKIYQQERERPVYLILDFNPSMFFGTRVAFKSIIATQVATLIAWASLKNGDRVGSLLIKDTFQVTLPCHRKHSLIELLKYLVDFSKPHFKEKCDHVLAFKRLKKVIKSGSLIYFLSDFYSFDDALKTELQQLAQKNEVNNIFIYDPLEKAAPNKGRYLFHNNVQPESLLLNTHDLASCDQYAEFFTERLSALKKFCFANRMQLTELCTSDDFVKVTRQLLNRKL